MMNGTTRGSVLPDLSRARALDLEQQPVLLNGMRVVFDERVGVYPVELEQLREAQNDERPDSYSHRAR